MNRGRYVADLSFGHVYNVSLALLAAAADVPRLFSRVATAASDALSGCFPVLAHAG
jgi:hypothetical protein